MNLKPAKTHEPVSILMIPFDHYSVFPKAVDALYKETRHPFELIVVEGNAPEAVRQELEKRKKKHKNFKILYSAHRPRMAEAFNLGLAHIRTRHAFLMHNSLRVTPGWLSNIMELAKTKHGVIYPYISHPPMPMGAERRAFPRTDYPVTYSAGSLREMRQVDMHGFLMTRQMLDQIGFFDETVATPLVGLDFACRLNAHQIEVFKDPYTVLEYRPTHALKGADLTLFQHQWDDQHTRAALAHLRQKWALRLDEHKYVEWLAKKRQMALKKPVFTLPPASMTDFRTVEVPKISLKKFIQVLSRA